MLPARSDLLWGQGGRWRAGQAAHPHCSQAGPAPSCLLRLTWAVPGPDPTRLHWPLGNPEVGLSQVTGTMPRPPQDRGTGMGSGSLLSPRPAPAHSSMAELQRPLLGAPHCCLPEGTAHPQSELSPWIPPVPPEAVSAIHSASLAPAPFGLEGWPAGLASCAPQGTHLPGVRSGCMVLGLSGVCELIE